MFALSIKDIIDIVVVATFIYYIFTMLRRTGRRALLTGIVIFLAIWIICSEVLEMKLMGLILNKFISIGLIILVIIFQEDIKRFLLTIGSAKRWRVIHKLLKGDKHESKQEVAKWIAPLVLASMNMAKKKTGALIVIQQDTDLSPYMHTGEMFEAEVSARLIENIFFKNSPLHDGAMIIANGKIKAAGCILPVAANTDFNKDLGLRHRSALGMSNVTDAKIIIVSEERGWISMAQRGEISVNIDADTLRKYLSE